MTEVATVARGGQPEAAEGAETARGVRIFRPLTDIVEGADGVTLMLEMPGVAPGDVEIELERRVLTIRGRAAVPAPESFKLAYAEYGEGDYERAFTLSEDFDQAKIAAEMHGGLLTVKLPRAEAAKPRRIAVAAG
ncbi:MAG: Hsp20/alpha crystallin family protein [Rhodospirillaceae bacterium]|nr:Hsp20/alpha crystallin family protein [Rhodospirillaceae bacterium]